MEMEMELEVVGLRLGGGVGVCFGTAGVELHGRVVEVGKLWQEDGWGAERRGRSPCTPASTMRVCCICRTMRREIDEEDEMQSQLL